MSDLESFHEALGQEVILEADIEGSEGMRSEAFTRLVIDTLIEAGELENAVPCYFRSRGVEVHGYGIDDGDTLNLISTIYVGGTEVTTLGKSEVNAAAKRLVGFWRRCLNQDRPLHDELEESSEAFDMALHISSSIDQIERMRVFVLTDCSTRVEKLELPDDLGLELRSGVWSIDRLFRLDSSGQAREPIAVDFDARFGESLRCLTASGDGSSELNSLLAVVPGNWIADIYDEYGARLLELNVRSFLQATGKVNRGIRDTLRSEPERFLAYNNGITATASEATLSTASDGQSAIRILKDLQVVNGGQTTASIHRARLAGVDLSSVFVQMKITIVPADELDEVVPSISRYANSQNKVSTADLSANDSFHVSMEELSRVVWTPAQGDSLRQSKWFYERARGQYRNEVANRRTTAQRRTWESEYPKSQSFSKTDLARFHNSWIQLPHIVARGAQKNFTMFMASLAEHPVKCDVNYFQMRVAEAILWKTAYRIAGKQYPSYRPNLASYAVSKLSHSTSMKVDLEKVWDNQSIGEALEDALSQLCALAWKTIVEGAPEGQNVGEWAKKEECWKRMKVASWTVPDSVDQDLRVLSGAMRSPAETDTPSMLDADGEACLALGSEGWYALSNWAKETGNLAPWQRKLAYSLGTRLRKGNPPTPKQGHQGKRILDEATRLGFVA